MGPDDFVARARYRYAAMGPHGYGTDLSGDGATVTPVYEEDSDQVGAGSLRCRVSHVSNNSYFKLWCNVCACVLAAVLPGHIAGVRHERTA